MRAIWKCFNAGEIEGAEVPDTAVVRRRGNLPTEEGDVLAVLVSLADNKIALN